MKYINSRRLGLVLFEPKHTHREMAQRLGVDDADTISAGFVGMHDPKTLYCYGESPTLRKRSDRGDTFRLQTWVRATMTQPGAAGTEPHADG
jgi:hypothetical protein